MKKRYRIWVDLDVTAGHAAHGVVVIEGVAYEMTAAPFPPPGSGERYDSEEGADFGEETISLGPRGGACPVCGR